VVAILENLFSGSSLQVWEWNMVFFGLCRQLVVFAALFGSLMFFNPLLASAAVIDEACDSAFMDKMKERAWMEAQREIMINQTMVWKPDSVLALGCYEQWIGAIKVSFSKDSGAGLTDVKTQATTYLSAAFPHTLGGGNGTGSNTSKCSNINDLWKQAQCKNLNLSQILTLKDISGNDPRQNPAACSSTGSWGTPVSTMAAVGLGAPFDSMNLFTSVVAPLSEVTSGKCSAGIPTGVFIGGGSNPEVVCPNPGCSPTGTSTPKCCKSGTSSC
jgi:hypothetical protein